MVNFSGFSREAWFGKLARVPLKWVPHRAVVPVLQGELKGLRSVTGAATHSCWLGSYELLKQRCFAAVVSEGDVIYDIGANLAFTRYWPHGVSARRAEFMRSNRCRKI